MDVFPDKDCGCENNRPLIGAVVCSLAAAAGPVVR